MFGLGAQELIIILIIVLLIFGTSKLGDIGSALGKGISGFKKAVKDDDSEKDSPKETDKS